jgi:signal transduction histidine kinase
MGWQQVSLGQRGWHNVYRVFDDFLTLALFLKCLTDESTIMKPRLAVSVVTGLLLAIGTFALWNSLRASNEAQIARIAEAESYAARSQLVQKIDTMLSAMEKVKGYWSEFGRLPRDQWTTDAGVELDHFKGIKMIVWHDQENNIRYARTDENPQFDHVPGDEEWESYKQLIERAHENEGNRILGPYTSDSGDRTFQIVFANVGPSETGVLAALVNIQNMLDGFLAEESPGFAVHVESEDETVIYQRGEPAKAVPVSWIRSGQIRSSFGSLWEVVHTPTDDLVKSFESPAIDLTILLGLIISALVATLIYENARARSRANAAEAAEAQVSLLNRDLEQKVIDRTDELVQRTADLETFTDSVAHDLRNPLNAIHINAHLLDVEYIDKLGPEGQAVLGRISPNVKQMAQVLDRLHGVSKVTNTIFERQPIDMRRLVTETFDQLLAAESDETPQVRLEVGELPNCHADKKLVQILMVNLLSNAIKFTSGHDQPRISVDANVDNETTVYSVRDNGVGFESSEAERIF